MNKKKKIRRTNLLQLGLGLLVIILLNIIGSFIYTRADLTAEKRYTLSQATRKLLKDLDDVVYFQVYLDGDFPAGFKRLRNATKEMLDEFRVYSDNIQYKFINPSESKDKKSVRNLFQQLISKGLEPTELTVNTNEGVSRQIVFPGAIVVYKGREIPLQLLMSPRGADQDNVLNNSIVNLEYNLANIIRKLAIVSKQKIAFIEGHGELSRQRLADISYTLNEYYSVDFVTINGKLNSLSIRDTIRKRLVNKFAAIIIAKPDSAFSEKDKFMIDQFVMRGGKVLWLIDPVYASMDSLQAHNETIGFGRSLNLDDMLFQYGARVNTDLVLDNSCSKIPVVTGQYGGQPQQSFLPWYYFPIVTPALRHPIVNNLNSIYCEFVSSLDTVGSLDIHKTILLTTSKDSRIVNTPCRISLDILGQKLDQRFFNNSCIPLAVLLEGRFKSLFMNRVPQEIIQDKDKYDFREEIQYNQMIVISDGDIIKNQIDQGNYLPLGYNKYNGQMFGNKDLILNAVDYLCDSSRLITIRSRVQKLRLLDTKNIKNHEIWVQCVNTVLPIVIILVFGTIWILVRRRIFRRVVRNK